MFEFMTILALLGILFVLDCIEKAIKNHSRITVEIYNNNLKKEKE